MTFEHPNVGTLTYSDPREREVLVLKYLYVEGPQFPLFVVHGQR
jgi:hypothetical protein